MSHKTPHKPIAVPRHLGLGSAAARLLGLRVRITPGAWTFVSCGRCLLSGRRLFDRPITRPEEPCRMLCTWVFISKSELWARPTMSKPRPTRGCRNMEKEARLKNNISQSVWNFIRLPRTAFQLHIFYQLIIEYNGHEAANVTLASKSSPITGLEAPRGFQEVKVPIFRDNGTGWW